MVTVITKTIGAGGGYDYANFATAESAVESIATTAFGSTDLVANDGAIVFEAVAGTYNDTVFYISTLTTDATRNVTYKAAAGSEHGGDPTAGVILGTGANTQDVRDDYTVLSGLHINGQYVPSGDGAKVSGCILTRTSGTCSTTLAPNNTVRIVYENSVFRPAGTSFGFSAYGQYGPAKVGFYNCTFSFQAGATSARGLQSYVLSPYENDIDIVNTMSLVGGLTYFESGGGTHTLAGSNNFGSSTNPFPAAIQGTPATITPSTAYDPGAGDFALYVGKNGALLDSPNNDVIDQGVGPSVNSDVPTTDILGNARSGATANPGAFEVPQATTIITKTIGLGGVAAGYDYANFATAESNVESIGTSTDLVYENEAIVFEAAAGTYNESVTFSSTLTTDATRNVTYRAAAGSEHGGVRGAGVHVSAASNTFTVYDLHSSFVGLSVAGTGSSGSAIRSFDRFLSCESCIVAIDHGTTGVGALQSQLTASGGLISLTNCVFERTGAQNDAIYFPSYNVGPYGIKLYNCTLRNGHLYLNNTASGVINIELVNTLALGGAAYTVLGSGTVNASGSNNFGGSTNAFPASVQGTPATITPTTSFSTPLGSGDYAVYMGATGALANVTGNDVWQQGVGPASNPDVPTTDINGVTRSGTSCNPGAFEADGFVAPTVITRTIGAAGPPTYDYASFTLAENAVTSIGTGTDLTFYNEAIVFEAVAGSYVEQLYVSSAIVVDATRSVTYRPASGSEHGGDKDSGVILQMPAIVAAHFVSDRVHLIGLVFKAAITGTPVQAISTSGNDTPGGLFESCIFVNDSDNPTLYMDGGRGSSAEPMVVRNCLFINSVGDGVKCDGQSGTQRAHYSIISNTLISGRGFTNWTFSGQPGVTAEFINNIYLGVGATFRTQPLSVVTGSNNFGNATNPFPVGIQGTPATITATTDVDPGPGDWAIYDAATGALIDDPDNDVLAGGIGPDANPDVPTTDIVGNTRSGATTDPGAFEISTLAPPEPALITIMRQIYQQDASFSVGASSAGVEKITHQLGPGSADFFTINSSTSATVSVPRTAHALRVICVVAAKACDVTLDLDASNSVFLGSIGGVASVQTDLTYFWSFGQVVSDGTYPRVRIVNDGFAGDQNVYLWWHLA